MLGILLVYCFQKLLYSNGYSIPYYGSPMLSFEFIKMIDATPLLISVINIGLHSVYAHYKHSHLSRDFQIAMFINLALGLLVFFIPWGHILNLYDFRTIRS